MQFFKKNQKRIVIFFLFAVLLVGVRLTIGKLQETIDNSPEANVRITSTGIDVENRPSLLVHNPVAAKNYAMTDE